MAILNSPWSIEQNDKIVEAINAVINDCCLANTLIHSYPLLSTDRTVALNQYDYKNKTIDETHVMLKEEEEPFSLTKLQTEDTDLALALMRVRQAAQKLARKHDHFVFDLICNAIKNNQNKIGFHPLEGVSPPYSINLVSSVSSAVALLDGEGYRTSYVMVSGHNLYKELHTRIPTEADIPVKAVKGLLEDGPVHRTPVLLPNEALVMSVPDTGDEIDQAVAVPPTLELLRIGANNDMREFRLYERYHPRFKQTYAAVLLQLTSASASLDRTMEMNNNNAVRTAE